jgi:DNA-binding response OmpR family regulator
MRLLLVEDNESLAKLIGQSLNKAGFDVDCATSVAEAQAALQTMQYAAVVLDLGLPDGDGLQVLRDLRKLKDSTPVIILTARNSVGDRVKGLSEGADDYIAKPFATEELVARVQAVLRRPAQYLGSSLHIGNLTLDTGNQQVFVHGKPKKLSLREATLLELLMRRHGQVVPKRYIEDQLFGKAEDSNANAIEVYVYRLRQELAAWGAQIVIHTVRGVGYLIRKTGANDNASE